MLELIISILGLAFIIFYPTIVFACSRFAFSKIDVLILVSEVTLSFALGVSWERETWAYSLITSALIWVAIYSPSDYFAKKIGKKKKADSKKTLLISILSGALLNAVVSFGIISYKLGL